MLNLKYIIIVMIAFLLGAQSNFNKTFVYEKQPQKFEGKKLKVLVTHTEGSYLMEINSVPQPFDIAGNYPYVLWINGARFHVPSKQLESVVASVGKENIPAINSNDIHKGWLRSFFAVDHADFPPFNFSKYENQKNAQIR